MEKALFSLKSWEKVFAVALLLYIIDDVFWYSAFYITIPATFLLGVVACILSMREKKYLHTLLCIAGIFLPVFRFIMSSW